MSKVILIRSVSIQLQPEEIAAAFWEFDSDEQAKFFNYLAQVTPDSYRRGMQFARMADCPDLTEHGKDFIRLNGGTTLDAIIGLGMAAGLALVVCAFALAIVTLLQWRTL